MFFLAFITAALMLNFWMTDASLGLEPKCSKFHYEEQMLHKMVRLEHSMELFEIEVKKMGVKMEAFTEDSLKLRDKHLSELDELDDIKAVIQKESEDLVLWKETNFARPTAFSVQGLSNLHPAKDEVLVYEDVLLNEGEGYDKSNGVFTAPTAGLYMFSAHVCSYPGRYIYYGIIVENNMVAISKQYSKDAYSCSSVTAVARVSKGGHAHVKCMKAHSSQQLYRNIYRWNSFNGILLKC